MANEVNDATFESAVIQSSIPVLVDFWAPWCGPCRAIAPVVEELASEYAGKVAVFKLNVDECPETPRRFGIRAIPTLLVFKGGSLVDQITGTVAKANIAAMLDKVL